MFSDLLFRLTKLESVACEIYVVESFTLLHSPLYFINGLYLHGHALDKSLVNYTEYCKQVLL